MSTDGLDRLLPLKTAWFHILLSLGTGEHHGYAIRRETEERTGGRVRLWPATLYGSLRELEDEGLIRESAEPADPDDDPRRRYYALTARGREALLAETERLQALVDAVHATGVVRGA
jgi:DNA-binding PadR family transcriptional regulator